MWSEKFEHPDKKNANVKNIFLQHKNPNKTTDLMAKNDRLMNGVALWTSFYRANPHRFAEEYLGVRLKLFQKILLYMMIHFNYVMYCAARGQGKSFLTAVYCVVSCVLFPDTKIVIASQNLKTSMKIISEKIQEMYDNSTNLQREICELKTGQNDPCVKFHNGSWIRIVTATQGSRGSRSTSLVVDEFRMVDVDVINSVLRKFLTAIRSPKYLQKPEYAHLQERSKEIYLSSSWYKHHWSWGKFQAFVKAMLDGKKYFVCGLPYQLSIKERLLIAEKVQEEMQEADFDPIQHQIEMECLFFGESEKAYFKFEEINKCRNINKPFIPITDEEFAQYRGDRRKGKFFKQKHPDELRFMGVDCALMGGSSNDSTVFTFIRCIPSDGEYIKSVEYIETMDGQHTSVQSLRLKQLFYDLDCDYCVMDTMGNGISIYDEVTKITFDNVRGIEYPAWRAMNDEKMQERAFDRNAVPLIYSMKVAGGSGAQTNHEMATYTKAQFQQKKIRLLCDEMQGRDFMIDKHSLHKMDSYDVARHLAPYVQTSRLINEMINLEMETRSGYIKLVEPAGHKKDRYSSLAYSLYYIKLLEAQLRVKEDDIDDLDLLMSYSVL